MRVVLFERDNLRWRHLAGTLPRCPTAVQHILPSSSMRMGRVGFNRGWRLDLGLAGANNPSVYRGRGPAYAFPGPPHPAFIVLMDAEFVLPVIFIGLWAAVRGSHSSRRF